MTLNYKYSLKLAEDKKFISVNFQLPIFYILLLVFAGCKTVVVEPVAKQLDVIALKENPNKVDPVILAQPIPQEYKPDLAPEQEIFDWENLANLPLTSYVKSPIPMPWAFNAAIKYSDDIRFDIKKSDGWELYLSSFSSKFLANGIPAMIFYNKYSGILRYYYYNIFNSDLAVGYNMLYSCLILFGSNPEKSPLLNFTNQKIIDVTKNSNFCYSLEPQSLSQNNWYAVEYEMAYDKNIYSQKGPSLMLHNGFSMRKASTLIVNGIKLENLNAKIRFPEPLSSPDLNYSGDVDLILYGKNDLNQLAGILSPSDLVSLNQTFSQNSSDNYLQGVLDNNSMGEVRWNADIKLSVYMSGVGIPDYNYYISGGDNSVIQGLCPFYPKALGVFYLNKKPTCIYTKLSDPEHPNKYELNVSTVEYIFNPSVKEIADIKNIKQELIATETPSFLTKDYSQAKLYTGQILTSNMPLTIQGVRVSFDVVPKNGSKTVHIVKTFQSDLATVN